MYRELQDVLTPAGLAWFQADWDSSLTDFFHNTLSEFLHSCMCACSSMHAMMLVCDIYVFAGDVFLSFFICCYSDNCFPWCLLPICVMCIEGFGCDKGMWNGSHHLAMSSNIVNKVVMNNTSPLFYFSIPPVIILLICSDLFNCISMF